jgi:tRNA wybutosine-synthesizing protein 2
MVLYSSGSGVGSLNHATWKHLLDSGAFGQKGLSHVAENAPIDEADVVRRPTGLVPLYGDFGPDPTAQSIEHPTPEDFESALWCLSIQNGIYQTWAPRYTMFSRGNIVEKTRLLGLSDVKGTIVIDLYCGIGYFVFSYARHCPKRIFCWEINAWSIEGLVRGAALNGWNARVIRHHEAYEPQPDDFIIVFYEENCYAESRLSGMRAKSTDNDYVERVSHINMGLLPDCRDAWTMAPRLGGQGTVLHIHENVDERNFGAWKSEISSSFGTDDVTLHKVKSFAPGVFHLVADVII